MATRRRQRRRPKAAQWQATCAVRALALALALALGLFLGWLRPVGLAGRHLAAHLPSTGATSSPPGATAHASPSACSWAWPRRRDGRGRSSHAAFSPQNAQAAFLRFLAIAMRRKLFCALSGSSAASTTPILKIRATGILNPSAPSDLAVGPPAPAAPYGLWCGPPPSALRTDP